jgi:hypothetical protein
MDQRPSFSLLLKLITFYTQILSCFRCLESFPGLKPNANDHQGLDALTLNKAQAGDAYPNTQPTDNFKQ